MKNESDIRWKAVETRAASKDGTFVYGVVTTGVYCKPSCSSRRALRENVRFYATPGDAERDGLRACKRCKPNVAARRDGVDARIRKACELISRNADQPLSLKEIAAAVGMSAFHFQRTFKAGVGLTPKEFHEAERVKKLKSGLKSSSSVTDAKGVSETLRS